MKVLRLAAYYPPEKIPGAHIVKNFEEALVLNNIDLKISTPYPTRGCDNNVRKLYKATEILHDGRVIIDRYPLMREHRNSFLRMCRYFLGNLIQYFCAIHENEIDIVFGSSTPPTQGVLCAKVAKKLSRKNGKKVPFVYNLQDIFPDSLVTTGLTKKGSILWKIGRKIEDYTYKNADKIIVISESMKKNIMDKGVPEDKVVVVSNWIDTDETKPVAKENNRLFEEFNLSRDKFTVVYAGNFGKAQGADVVLRAAELLRDNDGIRFVIFGGGQGFEAAKEQVSEKKLENVTINKLLPQDRVSEVYSLGDVALITCKKGVGNSGMPSKTWSIMACETPIIAAFDTDSELADILMKANAGVCVEPENPEALAEAILKMANGEVANYSGGRAFAEANASRSVCVAKYVDTIKEAVNG